MKLQEESQDNNNLPFKIIVTDISGLSEANQKIINLGAYENDETIQLLNTLKVIDELEQQKAMEKVEFSNEYLEFKIIAEDKEIPLNIKFGEGNFQKGIDHLIKIGSLELKDNLELKPEIKESVDSILNKKIDKEIFDNLLVDTLKNLDKISEPMDKNFQDFISSFLNSYLKTIEKNKEIPKDNKDQDKIKNETKENQTEKK
ncbi:hypothetical protein GO117_03055 [Campylobacter fetus]|uniref:hypothetical protein n=1 Tax=Campylobacter fetus TaxID=196 RepID=UPI00118D25CA|nr:hypothetical protein [Campylobacter fetus]EDO9794468.1 hypothetical protein [Campylobacter fetus]EJU9540114.1 hypothetical protein [Campylobacter fetus]QDS05349.1 hypothetical protein FP572_09125 [Campylobacter fetus subsp. fetus]